MVRALPSPRALVWVVIGYVAILLGTVPVMGRFLEFLGILLGEYYAVCINGSLLLFGLLVALVILRAVKGASPHTLAFLAIVVGVTLFWITQIDVVEERVHFAEYGVLGWLCVLATIDRFPRNALYGLVLLVIFSVGLADEVFQGFLPDRVFDLRDIGMNMLGGLLGVGVGRVIKTSSFS